MASFVRAGLVCSSFSPSISSDVSNGVGWNSFCLFQSGRLFHACAPKHASSRRRSMFHSAKSLDHIPKQFREENLPDGLAENYRSISKHFYGLTPSQMNMFIGEESPIRRQSERVTEQNISSAWNYLHHGGVWSLSGAEGKSTSSLSMAAGLYRGGIRGSRKRREPPPDLPSILLDARIVYLGMPIVPQVTELIVAQFLWLDSTDSTKPIYLYINSPGTQNEKRESVGSETDAYAIADAMSYCKAKVYTINVGMAYGQAAMILSVGEKGYRAVQPNSSVKLYLPKLNRSSGTVSDSWIKAKELDANTDSYIDLLSKGTGKSKEEIADDIKRPKFLIGEEAIAYGLADKILDSEDDVFEKENRLTRSRDVPAAQSEHHPSPESQSDYRRQP